jgi:endo-1,4-beta-xylanase
MSILACNTEPREHFVPLAIQESVSLRQAYSKWFEIGAAIPVMTNLSERERDLLFNQFGVVTPENFMKPGVLQPEPGHFVFNEADSSVNMALEHELRVNGHTLVWYKQNNDWIGMSCDSPEAQALIRERIRQHVSKVVKYFAGRISSWDVWNEAISENRNEYFRPSKCSDKFTQDLIYEAFSSAHEADPTAQLLYNDFGIEYPSKREKALRLIQYLKTRGLPVGIGIQAHYTLDRVPLNFIKDTLLAFDRIGVKVAISELDIDVVKITKESCKNKKMIGDPYPNGLPADVDNRLADQYKSLFSLFIDHASTISRVSVWALHDGRSGLNHQPCERTNHPMLWDRQLHPKLALKAVIDVATAKK